MCAIGASDSDSISVAQECKHEHDEELRLFTEDVLFTSTQQNDILSPTVHVIRDEIENTFSVFPHQSDPPNNSDISLESTTDDQMPPYIHTDRPPDMIELTNAYGFPSCTADDC